MSGAAVGCVAKVAMHRSALATTAAAPRCVMSLIQAGEVLETIADMENQALEVGFRPDTPIEVGVERFVKWYREYYGV